MNQYGGNDAKIKGIQPQLAIRKDENGKKFVRRGISVLLTMINI